MGRQQSMNSRGLCAYGHLKRPAVGHGTATGPISATRGAAQAANPAVTDFRAARRDARAGMKELPAGVPLLAAALANPRRRAIGMPRQFLFQPEPGGPFTLAPVFPTFPGVPDEGRRAHLLLPLEFRGGARLLPG